MATKEEMRSKLLKFYDDYEFFLEEAKIEKLTYYRYMNSFRTHDDLRKANTFIFGKTSLSRDCLKAYVLIAIQTLKELDRNCDIDVLIEKWRSLKLSGIKTDATIKYNVALLAVKNKWNKRSPRKRGNE